MSYNTFDPNLNIHPQALAVLALLNAQCFDEEQQGKPPVLFEAHAWYNGRERGIAITVGSFAATKSSPGTLVAVFGECRSSDSIFVDTWIEPAGFLNGPEVRDLPESAYQARKSYEWGEAGQAAKYISHLIREHLSECAKYLAAH